MELLKDFRDFIHLLNLQEVEYLVVGGYALAFHGKPRHTVDVDIWINISETNGDEPRSYWSGHLRGFIPGWCAAAERHFGFSDG